MKLFKIPAVLFLFILFIALFLSGLVVATAVLNSPTGNVPKEGVLFPIIKGESSEHVFVRLEQEGLVRSSLLIKIIAKLYNTESSLKTGIYRIRADQTTLDVHNLLVSGKEEMMRLTIKEGWTISQIAATLEQEQIASTAEFLQACKSPAILAKYSISGKTVEGFLFPETYYFPEKIAPEVIVTKMIDTFFEKIVELFPEYKNLKKEDLYDKVILASIVEREYRNEDEAPVIASVFYNRLKAKR